MSDIRAQSEWKHHGVRVIPGDRLDANTAQLPGMDRKAAINFARFGAHKLWADAMHIHPNAKTGAHHHGPLEIVRVRSDGEAVAVKLDIEPAEAPEQVCWIDPTHPQG